MQAVALIDCPWRDPVEAASALPDAPGVLALLTGGETGWSYLARDPDRALIVEADGDDPFASLQTLRGPLTKGAPDGPPWQGGVAGLCAYELGATAEGIALARAAGWPDLVCARYPAILAFDHAARRVVAVGRGDDADGARAQARAAAAWLEADSPPPRRGAVAASFDPDSADAYEAAVADVVARIEAGEIFQANVARRWTGRLADDARPFDLFARLARMSPAPYAAYLRLAGAALVSNSPERFLAVEAGGRLVRTEPIKGTRPRRADPALDAQEADALLASAKDRAENLMIVDLMRNDLSRVSEPGQVKTPQLFELKSFTNVHHLVSVVTGRLKSGIGTGDLLRAAFPPGSITGAPKVQAMRVIAGLEPPRGPFFGSIFWAGFDGALDSSVLIRTAAFHERDGGWDYEARAGAGIVADSDPRAEHIETEDKIQSLKRALTEPAA